MNKIEKQGSIVLAVISFLLILFVGLTLSASVEASTGRLDSEWTEGRSRFCKYDMGNGRYHVLVVDSHDYCPRNYRD
jgi:hypothetical protein